MHKTAYLFPLLTVGILVILFRNYDQWWFYLIMTAMSELILWLIMRRVSRTEEYLSGYALNIQHHEPWVEKIVRIETYTDSRGHIRTRQVVDYIHHPDVWLMSLNTGIEAYIQPDAYDYYRTQWGTPEQWINPPHANCVRGGGGQLYEWNGELDSAATHTYKGLYINYVVNSNSIFRKEHIRRNDVKEYGLIDYPDFDRRRLETDVILCSPKLPEWIDFSNHSQRAIHLVNAFAGNLHQIHIFVLVFDAAQGVITALKQQAYWKGGNKNEFVVCLGVDFNQPDSKNRYNEDSRLTVKWSKAFSWCDIPSLESATESYFIENKELDIPPFAEWLRGNINLWKRKEFKDFKYLGVRLSPGRKVLVAISTLLLCAFTAVTTCLIAIYNREEGFSKRDFSGSGYELLDKYILKDSSNTECTTKDLAPSPEDL